MTLTLCPITRDEAFAFIDANHRRGGASLRASGWWCVGVAGGGSWSRKDRPRVDTHPTQTKIRWEISA